MSKVVRWLAWTLLLIGGFVLLLRLCAVRFWQLPIADPYLDASVAPTLSGGDWLLLWRATSPAYGDLVLCPEPKTNRPVIGRLIGEQSDHLKFSAAGIAVNGRSLATESKCDRFSVSDPATLRQVEQSCSVEVVGSGAHDRGNTLPDAPAPETTEFDVPPGEVFLVSDNRLFPWDSRDFGAVLRASCSETVLLRLIGKNGFFDEARRLTFIH
jgi:signal peptidase I